MTFIIKKKNLLIRHESPKNATHPQPPPKRQPCPNLSNLWICDLTWQKGVCRCDWVKNLEMGETIMDYPAGPNVIITKVLTRGMQGCQSLRYRKKDMGWWEQSLEWCTLQMEEGATSQQIKGAPGSSKSQGNRFFPRASGRNTALLTRFWTSDIQNVTE